MPRPAPVPRVAVLVARHTGHGGRGDELFDYAGADAADTAFLAAVHRAGFASATMHAAGLDDIDAVVDRLDCDVVINLCDGAGPTRDGLPGLEALAALERRGLPYTGSGAEGYAIGCDKIEMKQRMAAVGVPTPAWQRFTAPDERLSPALAAVFPLFVKPRDSGGSVGIDLGSVVADEIALRVRLVRVCATYGEALVEQFIDGREITVGVVDLARGVRAFPPLEVVFGEAFPAHRGIRTFETKYDTHSPLYHGFQLDCPADLPPALDRRLRTLSRRAWQAVCGRGYGRVDFRLDAAGRPFALEVNANCSLEYSPTDRLECALLPIAAAAGGMPFERLLRTLVADALRRGKPRS